MFSWIALLVVGSFAIPAILFAPWVPARRRDFERIAELAGLSSQETFIDLGCGAGGLVLFLAEKTKARCVGIELAPLLYLLCKARLLFCLKSSAKFLFGNFLRADISQADVLFLFGTPKGLNVSLKEKITKEAKPTVRIVSYVFEIEGWKPERVVAGDKEHLPVFLYRKGEKIA